jgi:hypothetical protein
MREVEIAVVMLGILLISLLFLGCQHTPERSRSQKIDECLDTCKMITGGDLVHSFALDFDYKCTTCNGDAVNPEDTAR